jgi:hypothetical protein
MTEQLDKYRPPNYDNPTGPFSRWAFMRVTQFEQRGDEWVAWSPGEDWTVSAPTKDEAARQLQEHDMRRSDLYAAREAIFARHLQEPIRGIYAMDIGVHNQLAETECDEDINAAFEVAERYRQAGKSYTKADYERDIAGRDGQRD